jgi:TolB-like protein
MGVSDRPGAGQDRPSETRNSRPEADSPGCETRLLANPLCIRDDFRRCGDARHGRGWLHTLSGTSQAVFISYASQDAEAARRICEALRAAGIEVWFDQSELRGGDVWDRQIRQQIHECRLFMPIVSANTEARVEGYFRREWKLAVDRTHDLSERIAFLVPIVIDSTPEAKADVPDAFRHVQWTRLPNGDTPPAFTARIVALLRAPGAASSAVGSGQSATTTTSIVLPAGTAKLTPRSGRAVMALVGVVAVVLAYVVIDRIWLSKHPSAERPAAAVAPAPTPATPAIPEKSVAVLPFVDMSEKKNEEYFSDGLSEELIDMLTKMPELRVPARTSSFYFKGKQATITDIAKALRVANVLEGSVRKSGNTVRITAQLIRVDNGYHVWSETYDRKLDDIFKVQDEIAAAVVKALKVSLLGGDTPRAAATRNTEAYTLYLQGRALYEQAFNDKTLETTIRYLREAVRVDPAFADAWAALAIALQWAARASGLPDHTALLTEARRAAERAVSLNPRLGEAHRALGTVYLSEWDWTSSLVEQKRAYELDSSNASIARNLAEAMFILHVDDAVALRLFEKSINGDPLSSWTYDALGLAEFKKGEYREAEAAARKAIDLTNNGSRELLAWILLESERPAAALSECAQLMEASSRSACIALAYHALGRKAESDASLNQLERTSAASDAYKVAEVHAYRGEADQAFNWLDRAYVQRDDGLTHLNRDPLLGNLRGDPRYKAFLRKMNLPD